MPRVERIESWRGQDVLDSTNTKAGRLDEVYYDAAGREPVLISVKHVLVGHKVKLFPVRDAVLSHDYLRLPYGAEQIADAPGVSVGDELSSEQSAAVCALFGVEPSSGSALYSASMLERQRWKPDQA